MNHYNDSDIINIGWGKDQTIRELAETVTSVVGYEGDLLFDTTKPDGTMRKLQDVSRMQELGWVAKVALREGMEKTYQWFLQNQDSVRK